MTRLAGPRAGSVWRNRTSGVLAMYVRRTKGWPSKAEQIPGGGIRFLRARVTMYRLQSAESPQHRAASYEVTLQALHARWEPINAKIVETPT